MKPTNEQLKKAAAKAHDRVWRLGLPKLAAHGARQAEVNFWADPVAVQGGGVPWVSLFDRDGDPVRGFEAPKSCDGQGTPDYLWDFLVRYDKGGYYAMYHFTAVGSPEAPLGALSVVVMSKTEYHVLACPIVEAAGGGYDLGRWQVTTQTRADQQAN
jgi:hypothetical protein